MGRWRVSMAGLMGAVLFAGLVLAALRSGSDAWFRAVYTVTTGVLLAALAVGRRRGPFWPGFAAIGLGYFAIGFGPWIPAPPGADGRGLNRNLATATLIEAAVTPLLDRDQPQPTGHVGDYYLMREGRKANLVGIAHAALTVVLAVGGGMAARVAAGRKNL